MSAFDPLRTLAKFLPAPPHIMTCGVRPSEDTCPQLATAAALTVQIPVRQPCQEAVNRHGRDHAQPAAEIEKWRDAEREQEEREVVSVHGASRDSTRCREQAPQARVRFVSKAGISLSDCLAEARGYALRVISSNSFSTRLNPSSLSTARWRG